MMGQPRKFAVLCFVVWSAGFAACSSDAPEGTAITDVTVIDAVNGMREGQTVLVVGERIAAVVASADELPNPPAETVDGAGKFLIPGLWDMHVHLTYDDAFTEDMPRLFLLHGITSVRDTGGLMHKIEPVVERMRAPDALAPRVFFSGPLLDGTFVVYDGESRPEIGVQNATAEAARARIAELAEAGVDFVKIYEMVSPDVFEALAAEARAHELPIAAHVPLSMMARGAGPQVDSMEHLRNVELDCAANAAELYEERLAAIAAHESGPGFELRSSLHAAQRTQAINNYDPQRCAQTIESLRATIQVPTLRLNTLAIHPTFARADWDAVLDLVPTAAEDQWRTATAEYRAREVGDDVESEFGLFGRWSLDLVGRMHAAGVPIGAGTDTPIGWAMPGDSLHTELERLVEAGLSPLDALTSATLRPAEFHRVSHEMGTIEAGRLADLVLLEANPLVDISNTRRIDTVVTKGRFLSADELR